MSDLSIRIDQPNSSGFGEVPSVLARISRLDRNGRTVKGSTRHELVPISQRKADAIELVLPPGTYAVEARLTNGELLTEFVVLREGVLSNVVLQAQGPSDRWLSWQYLSGNQAWGDADHHAPRTPQLSVDAKVPQKGVARRVATRRFSGTPQLALPPPGSQKEKSSWLRGSHGSESAAEVAPAYLAPMPAMNLVYEVDRSYLRRHQSPLEAIGLEMHNGVVRSAESMRLPAVWKADESASVTPARPIHLLEGTGVVSDSDFLQRNPWETLPQIQGTASSLLTGLMAGRRSRTIASAENNGSRAIFSTSGQRDGGGVGAPSFAVVRRRMGVELICLPGNPSLQGIGDAEIEVGVRRPRFEHQFSSSVVVRDRQLAVLLSFLSTGDLSTVNLLIERSQVMLAEKNVDLVSAAAGGYALVGSAVDATHQDWHGWIKNLMDNFEMPDGAIQYGMMRLRLRRSRGDVRAAADAFKDAYRRGLPVFGMGMRWLLDGLERTSSIDAEARSMAASVRRLAFRLHPHSPFTILRLGKL